MISFCVWERLHETLPSIEGVNSKKSKSAFTTSQTLQHLPVPFNTWDPKAQGTKEELPRKLP
jgi:hypothetical protein